MSDPAQRHPSPLPAAVIGCAGVMLLVAAILALLSDGNYQDDSLTHYLMARWSWAYPKYLLDEWGRPAFTGPYMLVANIGSPRVGFAMARLMTVACVGVSAWAAWRVALRVVAEARSFCSGMGERWVAGLGAVAVVGFPLNFTMSFDTMTEPICAAYVGLGTWLMLKDRTRWAAIVFSMVPLARHEGAALLPVVAALLAWRRDWVAIPLLAVGEVAWNVAKPMAGFPWKELPILRFFGGEDVNQLGYGGPLHYVMALGEAVGPAMLGPVVLGAILLTIGCVKRLRNGYDPVGAAMLLCGPGTLAMLLLQTLLYMVNTHASGGYARFLLPAAPWMGVCVAAAVAWLLAEGNRRRLALAAGVMLAVVLLAAFEARRQGFPPYWGWPKWFAWLAPVGIAIAPLLLRPSVAKVRITLVLLGVVASLTWLGVVRPQRLAPHTRLVGEVMAYYANDPQYRDHLVVGDNPWTHYFSNRPMPPGGMWAPTEWFHTNVEAEGYAGLIYLWDQDHSITNLPLDELQVMPHRRLPTPQTKTLRERSPEDSLQRYLIVFERIGGSIPDGG